MCLPAKNLILPYYYMRQLIILTVLFVFWGCNNNEGRQTKTRLAYQADELLMDSIAKFPDSLLLKERLIQYYRDSAEYEKAIAVTDGFLRKDSLNARLWDIKATLYFENEDSLNAIRSLETAVQISGEPLYLMKLGSLYAKAKDKRALGVADALLQNKFTNTQAEAFYVKGLYYSYSDDKTKSVGFFDRALAIDYNYMPAYLEKAIVFYDMGRYEDAIKVLDRAVTLQNKFDEGYYWKGRCLEKLNKPNEAVEEYQTALMYSPDFTEAKDALARLGVK